VTHGSDVVPVRALDAVAAGSAAGVDLLIGTTLDEVTVFSPTFLNVARPAASAGFGALGLSPDEALGAYTRSQPRRSGV
jgi:carboxylesterase type B